MRISDLIEQTIAALLTEYGVAEIRRNDLAMQLGCVPSQINYVLSTRFSPQNGYMIESRRGGGGYIKVTRVALDAPSLIMHTVQSIGERVSASLCDAIVKNLYAAGALTERESAMLLYGLSDGALCLLPCGERDVQRARILSFSLMAIADQMHGE